MGNFNHNPLYFRWTLMLITSMFHRSPSLSILSNPSDVRMCIETTHTSTTDEINPSCKSSSVTPFKDFPPAGKKPFPPLPDTLCQDAEEPVPVSHFDFPSRSSDKSMLKNREDSRKTTASASLQRFQAGSYALFNSLVTCFKGDARPSSSPMDFGWMDGTDTAPGFEMLFVSRGKEFIIWLPNASIQPVGSCCWWSSGVRFWNKKSVDNFREWNLG